MGRHTLEYPRDVTNLVKRKGDRGVYELEKIHTLVNATQILHVSFQPKDSPFPVILPMIGQMGSFDRPSADLGDPLDLYLHGYVSSRMMNLARASGGDSKEGDTQGMPVCVAASHCDGLVLALSAFSSSYNYRSAVLFGYATIVESQEEKLYAMDLITDSVVPGRWADTRLPPTGAEMQSTSILRVKIKSGSAKFRTGTCGDEKFDMEDEAVLGAHWAGVVPVRQVFGEPIPGPYNKVETPPAYLSDYIKDSNKDNEEYSLSASK